MKIIRSLIHYSMFFFIFESYLITSVKAQCVQADASVQYNISSSRKPTQRTNDVTMESNPNCRGNSSVTRGVQGHIGPNETEQNRRVSHSQEGNDKYPEIPNGRTVQIRSNVQVDVDNPAERFPHNPNK